MKYILITIGIFCFIELQVILVVSINTYINIKNNDNTQFTAPNTFGGDRPNMSSYFGNNNNNDDISNSVVKPGNKNKTSNEKPSI